MVSLVRCTTTALTSTARTRRSDRLENLFLKGGTEKEETYASSTNRTDVFQVLWTKDGSALSSESTGLWHAFTGQSKTATTQQWGWLAAVHPDHRERVKQQWKEAVASRTMFSTQFRLLSSDGEEQAVPVLSVPLFKDKEVIEEWIGWIGKGSSPLFPLESSAQQNALISDVITRQAPLGVALFSLDRKILQVNEQYCTIMGYARSHLLGRRLYSILPRDICDMNATILRQMLLGKMQRYAYEELEYVRPDGTTLWLKITITLVWHAQGVPLFLVAWVEDTSTQRRREQEQQVLLAQEHYARVVAQQASGQAVTLNNMFQAVFGTVIDSIVIYDQQGKITHINDAARTLLELGSEEHCLGKTYPELLGKYQCYDEGMRLIPLERLPMVRLAQGQTVTSSLVENLLVRFPSGHERYLDLTSTPLSDQQGQVAGLVSVFRDVTARHAKELQIRQAFTVLSTLIEAAANLPLQALESDTGEQFVSASLPVIGHTLSAMIHQLLDCSMVGLSALEGPERRMHFVGVSGLSQEVIVLIQQDMEDSTLSDFLEDESINRLSANQVVIRDLTKQPFVRRPSYGLHNFLLAPMLLHEQLVGIFGIDRPSERRYTQEEIELVRAVAKMAALVIERGRLFHTLTQACANELALQETNRRFDVFLSMASHELRTPLTGIRGTIQLVLRRIEKAVREGAVPFLTEATVQRFRRPLEEALQRVMTQDRMISDLLDVSRIQANRLEFVGHPCNLVEIVRHAFEDSQYVAPDHPIEVHWTEDEIIPLHADADRIGQVVSNYLNNALKYSLGDEPIHLFLSRDDAHIHVAVKDSGPGLTPEEQQVVWDRFYRVRGIEVLSGSGTGLGLGLYLCRAIIEWHGGRVGVESVKGEGSTFWFTLPLTPAHENSMTEHGMHA